MPRIALLLAGQSGLSAEKTYLRPAMVRVARAVALTDLCKKVYPHYDTVFRLLILAVLS
jgi:hypothetical protein